VPAPTLAAPRCEEAIVAQGPVRITDEIFQVGGLQLTAPEDAAIYLLACDGSAALIDAGCGRANEMLLRNIEAAGVKPEDIELLLITHCHFDHTGGARWLRERLGCAVVMHELDAPYLEAGDPEVTAASWYGSRLEPCIVDRKLAGNEEEIRLGERIISAVHIPGHSPGSVAYVTTSAGLKIVFAQDVHGPLHPALLSNAADYQASLRRLIDLDADVLCEGHYGIYKGRQDIVRFVSSFMQ
jgi:glyoxylase-like metal-dependent hydrolase (beta-lactamase superfamily II)